VARQHERSGADDEREIEAAVMVDLVGDE
jgi:hypothetical protein